MNENIEKWIDEFAGKHFAKGSHRWAFWIEGVVIGIVICHFWL